jgi:integrase
MTGAALVGTLAPSNVPVRATRATPPASAITTASRAVGDAPPAYVTREQVRAMVAACETTRDRLLLETLWQSGGRVSEVCALRACDLDRDEGGLVLTNLKQRGKRRHLKLVYVSRDLIGALSAFVRDLRLPPGGYLWRSRVSGDQPMNRREVHRIVNRAGLRAGVTITGRNGERLPTGLDFRHGAAVHLLRSGQPLTEVQAHLGHARIETTTIYTRLTNAERRNLADRVAW